MQLIAANAQEKILFCTDKKFQKTLEMSNILYTGSTCDSKFFQLSDYLPSN